MMAAFHLGAQLLGPWSHASLKVLHLCCPCNEGSNVLFVRFFLLQLVKMWGIFSTDIRQSGMNRVCMSVCLLALPHHIRE